jgi:hypothetical protein
MLVTPPGPLDSQAEEYKLFQLLSGVSVTHRLLLGDLPFANREIRTRGFASSTLTISILPSPIPDGQPSSSRDIATRDVEGLSFQTPSPKCAIPRVVLHTISVGPVATRDLAISPCSLRVCKCRSAESRVLEISCHLSLW